MNTLVLTWKNPTTIVLYNVFNWSRYQELY